jgi:hypothetical protein
VKALVQVKESRSKPASGGRANRAWLSAPERARLTVEVVGRRPPARVQQTPLKDVSAAAAAPVAATQGFDLASISLGQPGAPAPVPEVPAALEAAPPADA